MTASSAREILERRARELARPAQQAAPTDLIEVLTFRIAGERFAVELRDVRAVFQLARLSPVPGAVPPLVGITMHRGNLLTLLDVRAALGLSVGALNDLRMVLVVGDEDDLAGMLVDAVDGADRRRLGEFRPRAGDRAFVRGVADDATLLIAAQALAAHQSSGETK